VNIAMASKAASPGNEHLGLLLGLLAAGVSLAAWSIVAWGFWRGIDLTDEGYYLNSISSPFIYKSSYSQFGFLLHPFYLLVGGDLILFRLVGLILLTTASAALISAFLRIPAIGVALERTDRILLAVAGSGAALLSYFSWIPTPSYNLLNLFGVLIIFTGWFEICRTGGEPSSRRWRRFISAAVCGVGFAVVALVKPTTAAALAVVLTSLTLAFGRRALADIVGAGVVSFLLVVLVLMVIDGDPSAIIMRYRSALQNNELSQSGHDLHGLFAGLDLRLGYRGWATLLLMAVLGPLVSMALSADGWKLSTRLVICAGVLSIQFFLARPLITFNYNISFWSLGVLTLTGIFTSRLLNRGVTPEFGEDRRYIALLLGAFFAPVAVGFGTDAGIWQAVVHAGLFWALTIALLVVLAAPRTLQLLWLHFTMAATACLVIEAMIFSVQRPYRIIGPLSEQTEWISSARSDRVVKVDPATAIYFRSLLTGARSAGFQVGTPIIDLTGIGPTTQYLLGGEPVGLAWISGGYPGSRDLALHAISQVPRAKLQQSWILTAPAGHDFLPIDILTTLGLRFPDEYEEVARARTSFMDEEHILWRPRSAKARSAPAAQAKPPARVPPTPYRS
jgi:hypothetical protein